jgi:hypothetical protein
LKRRFEFNTAGTLRIIWAKWAAALQSLSGNEMLTTWGQLMNIATDFDFIIGADAGDKPTH